MTSIQAAVDYYNYVIHDLSDPRTSGRLFMGSPFPLLILVGLYYHFVKHSGPKFMEKRKPYDLKKIMIFYNVGQCVVNIWAFYQVVFLSWFYFMVKIVDLMDTVFMVLRKNYRQITFLHLYHHIGMTLGCWIVVKYIAGAHLTMVGVINALVHTVMYFYYLLTAYDSELKKSIWWKKHLTEMQMVQFFLIMVHHAVALVNTNCNYPKGALTFFLSQNVLMFYLFGKFYIQSYVNPKKNR